MKTLKDMSGEHMLEQFGHDSEASTEFGMDLKAELLRLIDLGKTASKHTAIIELNARLQKAEALAAQEHEKAEGYRLSQEGIVVEAVKERKRADDNADKALANLESGVHWNTRAVAAEAREITLKSERDQARAEKGDARQMRDQHFSEIVRAREIIKGVIAQRDKAEIQLSTARTALTGAQIDFNFIAGLAQGREEMHSVFGQIERTATLAAKYSLAALTSSTPPKPEPNTKEPK